MVVRIAGTITDVKREEPLWGRVGLVGGSPRACGEVGARTRLFTDHRGGRDQRFLSRAMDERTTL